MVRVWVRSRVGLTRKKTRVWSWVNPFLLQVRYFSSRIGSEFSDLFCHVYPLCHSISLSFSLSLIATLTTHHSPSPQTHNQPLPNPLLQTQPDFNHNPQPQLQPNFNPPLPPATIIHIHCQQPTIPCHNSSTHHHHGVTNQQTHPNPVVFKKFSQLPPPWPWSSP